MRLFLGVSAAFAGLAAAASQPAEVYSLYSPASRPTTPESPSLPRQLARLIFLQRLFQDDRVGSLRDVPDSIRADDAISYINTLGKSPRPLLADRTTEPRQLLILLEGLTGDKTTTLNRAVHGWKPAFTVVDPPSAAANMALAETDLAAFDLTNRGCSMQSILTPTEDSCVSKGNRVVRIDAQKDPRAVEILSDRLPHLARFAASGEMETTLVLIPESSRESGAHSWATNPVELRVRQVIEEVMTESEDADPVPTTPASNTPFFPGKIDLGSIPACFQSQNSCVTATNNCSGHGLCANKYTKNDGTADGQPCFYCACSKDSSENPTQWAGPACTKIDISTPFWLFVGFTIVLIGVLTFAIGLLFAVGEEQLPGVIGAGVSRSK